MSLRLRLKVTDAPPIIIFTNIFSMILPNSCVASAFFKIMHTVSLCNGNFFLPNKGKFYNSNLWILPCVVHPTNYIPISLPKREVSLESSRVWCSEEEVFSEFRHGWWGLCALNSAAFLRFRIVTGGKRETGLKFKNPLHRFPVNTP